MNSSCFEFDHQVYSSNYNV